jgi:hypothetical protein
MPAPSRHPFCESALADKVLRNHRTRLSAGEPPSCATISPFASFRHAGFAEAADADLTDAQLRAAGRHRSARQLPNAHVSNSSLSPKSGTQSERIQHVCHNERLTGCQNYQRLTH